MLTAHAYWRELGLATTLVVLTLEATARESVARLSGIPGVSVFGPDAFDARGLARLRAEADWIVRDGTSPQAMSAPTRDGGTPAPSAIPSGTVWAEGPEAEGDAVDHEGDERVPPEVAHQEPDGRPAGEEGREQRGRERASVAGG